MLFKTFVILFRVDCYINNLTHQEQTAFVNIVGKGQIAHNEQFLLFPKCFLRNHIIVSPFVHIFYIISLFAAELEAPKIGISGKGLIKVRTLLVEVEWWPYFLYPMNSLPNDKILNWSKLKAFADDKIKVFNMIIFVFDRVENNVENGENAGYLHFLLFHKVFKRSLCQGC